jgi:hypothetical protein
MENVQQFLDDNRTAVVQEMAKCLNMMNAMMGSIIETDDNEEGEIAKNKILFQMFHTLGAMTVLYNQFIYFETGEIPESDSPRPIGFEALLDPKAKPKD